MRRTGTTTRILAIAARARGWTKEEEAVEEEDNKEEMEEAEEEDAIEVLAMPSRAAPSGRFVSRASMVDRACIPAGSDGHDQPNTPSRVWHGLWPSRAPRCQARRPTPTLPSKAAGIASHQAHGL